MYISSSPHFSALKSLHLFLLMCKMRLSFILKEAAVQRLLITPYCQKHAVSLSIMANFMIWEVETAVKRFIFQHQFLASASFSYAYTAHLQSKDFCNEASNYYLGHPPSIIQGNWNHQWRTTWNWSQVWSTVSSTRVRPIPSVDAGTTVLSLITFHLLLVFIQ